MPEQMGIGQIGQPGVIIKRKFRWTLEILTKCGTIPKHYVKVAGRPKLALDTTEINYLNATTWIPGKAKWEPISVTWLDVASSEMQSLWNWVATIYGFENDANLKMSEKEGWAGVGTLILYDGCGNELERWTLKSLFPESVDFGDLSMDDSEIATIDMSLRYSEVQYQSTCPKFEVKGCPKGCSR